MRGWIAGVSLAVASLLAHAAPALAAGPTISIAAPVDGAAYVLGEVAAADYSCASGSAATVTACSGPVAAGAPIDTASLGIHTFAVHATDSDGQASDLTAQYLVDAPLYGTAILADGPLALWRLGDPAGTTALRDETGSHSGTCVNGVAFGQRGPLGDGSGGAALFPARNGYCSVNGVQAPATAYTLEAWVRPADGADMEIVGQPGAGQLFVKGARLSFRQVQNTIAATVAPAPGRWSLVDATWDGATARLYLDGALVASGPAPKAPSGSGTAYVGYGDQAPWFHGMLAEVAYYRRALSAATIARHEAIGSYVAPPFDGGVQPDGRVQSVDALDDPTVAPFPVAAEDTPPEEDIDGLEDLKDAAAAAGDGSGAPGPEAAVFGGLNQFGLTAANSSPPDPTGAIGPSHYVEMVNSKVGVYSRALGLVGQAALAAFVGKPADFVFDPQIQWDEEGQRWLYLADDLDGAGHAFLAYGWSKTTDPSNLASGWCRYAISTTPNFDDYPKLGHSDRYVVFGTNVFDFAGGTVGAFRTARIWSLPKPAAGAIATCPAAPAASFWGTPGGAALTTSTGQQVVTPVPANTTDASADGYVVAADAPYYFASPSRLRTRFVTVGGTLGPEASFAVAPFAVPNDVPQPSTAFKLDAGDTRLTQVVAHADPGAGGGAGEALWTQHTVASSGGRSEVRWYELLPASAVVRQAGTIANPTNFVFDGAISPAANGAGAAIHYDVGGSARTAEIRAQSRSAGDPLGAMSNEVLLGAGVADDHDFTCTGGTCRWGDYAGASPDPDCASSSLVWGTNELSGAAVTNPYWSTRNFALQTATAAAPAAPWSAPATLSAAGQDAVRPSLAVSAGGQATALWERYDGTNVRLQLADRPPGAAFGAPQTISPPGQHFFDPELAFDAQCGSTLVWERQVTPDDIRVEAVERPASLGPLGAPITLSGPNPTAFNPNPHIAIDPQGARLATWVDSDGSAFRVETAARAAAGTFGAKSAISLPGLAALDPQIAFAANGDAVAVWTQQTAPSAPFRIYVADRPSGGTFGPATAVSTAGSYTPGRPQVVVDASGATVVAWDGNDEVVRAAIRPAGGAFGPAVALSAVSEIADSVALARAANGDATAIWQSFHGAAVDVDVADRADGAAAFGPQQTIGSGGPFDVGAMPAIAFDGDRDAYAIWRTYTASGIRIAAATRPVGGVFGPSAFLSAAGQDADTPSIAGDGAANAIALWRRFDGSHYVVQAAMR